LNKKDKSSIGEWDEHIEGLCDKINSLENYYTTSSCSGRIIVLKDVAKKGPGLFEFVSHDSVDEKRFFEFLKEFSSCPPADHPGTRSQVRSQNLIDSENFIQNSNLKFKSEPLILHIACRDLDSAKILLDKIRDAGFKRAGIISLGKNIIIEIIGTEKMEFPLVKDGKLLVNWDFLKIVLERANSNLERGWEKIKKLRKLFD